MAKNLVIVESPAKAKTIEKYLGKDFMVKSSFGHVRDLEKSKLSIDVENDFKPTYVISEDKQKIVSELTKLAKEAEMIWLATDEDREGEAISWHLEEALKLEEKKTKRITFNEITKNAVLKAIDNPREINRDLVNAQQARRVLDRLVGFELSPVLWRKIKPALSAGRVQSVAVRLIVEREREIIDFKSSTFFKIVAEFDPGNGGNMKAELNKRFDTEQEAMDFLKACGDAKFQIQDLEVKPSKRKPSAPFTTSTLQQEASRKLGYSVAQTMVQAQKLYEAGFITYMRTDSVNLSETALNGSKAAILDKFGDMYSHTRTYTSRSKGAQEAHEAIRPTDFNLASVDTDQGRLYELIWKRSVASQMADAELEKTVAKISISNRDEQFIARGEVIKFDGFLKLYMESKDDEDEDDQAGVLPPLKVDQVLDYNAINGTQRFTKHPARYTEASLVKKLEELGIGRPSTYAPTISTVQKRQYVLKENREGKKRDYLTMSLANGEVSSEKKTEITGAEKNKLFPTDVGMVVNDFLVEHFKSILSYDFTANVEKEFDEIANGQKEWIEMIKSFYTPFHTVVEDTLENSERAKGERLLGVDPKSGRNVYARIGRFGPMIQIGEREEEEKPKFASLLKEQSITTINLEEALELFKLPRDLGEYEGDEVAAGIGRFGPFVRYGKSFVSIPKDTEFTAYNITLDEAIELIKAKKEADKNKFIAEFPEKNISVLNGRYGPYIKAGKKNVKIPKGTDPKTLTLEDCEKIVDEALKAKKKK
ncbi:MAG: type I DNA topoisomerase [Flavobacteriales bacterium]|nr:type I DNA topoisomerase [Flavobacteriales bacterium]